MIVLEKSLTEDLLALADKLAPSLRRAFLDAVDTLRTELTTAEVADLSHGAHPTASDLWQRLQDLLTPLMALAVGNLLLRSGQTAIESLPPAVQVQLQFDLTNPQAIQAVDTLVSQSVREIANASQDAVQVILRQGFTQRLTVDQMARRLRASIGLTKRYATAVENFRAMQLAQGINVTRANDLADAYARRLLNLRATTIARTESIRAMNAGQHTAWQVAAQQHLLGTEVRRHYLVTPDDRLCFIAGTKIATADGERPIETVAPGDVVWTHAGLRPVTATMARVTTEQLTAVFFGGRSCLGTEDHPVLCRRGGRDEWVALGDLQQGDLLYQFKAQGHGLAGADHLYLSLTQPNDIPTVASQPILLPNVPSLIPVPVVAIHFKSDALTLQEEVDRIAAQAALLDEGQVVVFKGFSYAALQQGLCVGLPIACEGTELPPRSGLAPENFSACFARGCNGRPPAEFGAVLVLPALVVEDFTATLAGDVGSGMVTTTQGAHGISISDACGNSEILGTDRARFSDSCLLDRSIVATPRAIFATPDIESNDSKGLMAVATDERGWHSQSKVATNQVAVYTLEIAGARTFMANGFLVHNCPICEAVPSMNPGGVALGEPFQTPVGPVMDPPLHVACRCSETLHTEAA